MHLFPHREPDMETLGVWHVTEQDTEQEDEQQNIPWHCAWCQPYVDGATSGICSDCEKKYFPKKR